jgi:hypothetical protein
MLSRKLIIRQHALNWILYPIIGCLILIVGCQTPPQTTTPMRLQETEEYRVSIEPVTQPFTVEDEEVINVLVQPDPVTAPRVVHTIQVDIYKDGENGERLTAPVTVRQRYTRPGDYQVRTEFSEPGEWVIQIQPEYFFEPTSFRVQVQDA